VERLRVKAGKTIEEFQGGIDVSLGIKLALSVRL
jgi:hypothetical protein